MIRQARSRKPPNIRFRSMPRWRRQCPPVHWIGTHANEWQIEIPLVPNIGLPLMEILPFNCSASTWQHRSGLNPDIFSGPGKSRLLSEYGSGTGYKVNHYPRKRERLTRRGFHVQEPSPCLSFSTAACRMDRRASYSSQHSWHISR